MEPVHIFENKPDSHTGFFYSLIPVVVFFALLLSFVFFRYKYNSFVPAKSAQVVLSDSVDNSLPSGQNR